MTALKTLTLLIAAFGMLLIESLRSAPTTDEDDDVGLFVGSAHPVAAKTPVARRRR
jgi:hypothetical protein